MLVRGAEPMENRQRRSLFISLPSSLIVLSFGLALLPLNTLVTLLVLSAVLAARMD